MKKYYVIDDSKINESLIEFSGTCLDVEEADESKKNYLSNESNTITKEQLEKIASILNKAYNDCEEVIGDNAFIYEKFEDIVGSHDSHFITYLAHYLDLTKLI